MRFAHEREFSLRVVAEQSEWLTLPKAIEQTEDLLKTANEPSKSFLAVYKDYLVQRLQEMQETASLIEQYSARAVATNRA